MGGFTLQSHCVTSLCMHARPLVSLARSSFTALPKENLAYSRGKHTIGVACCNRGMHFAEASATVCLMAGRLQAIL